MLAVLRHALRPYLHGQDEGAWAGRHIRLQQIGLEWQLVSVASSEPAAEDVLLTIVPWLTEVPWSEDLHQLPVERFIAWPAIGQEPQQSACQGSWITLSPSDMYCVERFGQLVDQALYRMVLSSYSRPLTKIPVKVLTLADGIHGVHVDHQAHALEVRETEPEESVKLLKNALIAANSTRQGLALEQLNQEILALENCPVCKAKADLVSQRPAGFRTNCVGCGTQRYLRQQDGRFIFEQVVSGRAEFLTIGRRAFSMQL